uniref:Brix domain-containing protein n=1 Tax=Parastrongyloides trichosuri TaxID=131310 RepID=A0A0N4ZVD2_PARTI
MKTRSSISFKHSHIKAIIGKRRPSKNRREYLVQFVDEEEPDAFVDEKYIRYGELSHLIDEYENLSTNNNENVRVEFLPQEVRIKKYIAKKEKILKERRAKNKVTIVKNSNNTIEDNIEKAEKVLHGKTVFEYVCYISLFDNIFFSPITINGKKITMADIIKWSKLYNKFNNFKGITLDKIFGRSHEICYDDVSDYKFFALTTRGKVIVFTKSQINFHDFFLPMMEFMKKYPFEPTDPIY